MDIIIMSPWGMRRSKKEAIDRGADIVLYGHTHRPVIDIDDDIIAVNPEACLIQDRKDVSRLMPLWRSIEKKKVHFTIAYLR